MWADVVSAGVSLLGKLGQALQAGSATGKPSGATNLPGGLIARDERTDQPYLKLPLPDPQTLQKITDVLSSFAARQ